MNLNRLFEEILNEDNTQDMMAQWQQMYNPTMQQQQQNYNDVLRSAGQGNNNFFTDMGKTINKGAYDTAKTIKKIQNLNNSGNSSQNNGSSSNQNGQSAPTAQNAIQQTQTNSTATSQQPQTNSTATSQSPGNSQKLEKNIGEIKKDTEEIKKLLSKQQESLFEEVFLECLFERVLRESLDTVVDFNVSVRFQKPADGTNIPHDEVKNYIRGGLMYVLDNMKDNDEITEYKIT